MRQKLMQMLSVLCVLILVVAVGACAPAEEEDIEVTGETEPGAAGSDREAIDRAREEHQRAYSAGDAEAWSRTYTEDAVVMPPNEPTVEGRQGIQQWHQGLADQYQADLRLNSSEVQVAGDWAYDYGTYTIDLTPAEGGMGATGEPGAMEQTPPAEEGVQQPETAPAPEAAPQPEAGAGMPGGMQDQGKYLVILKRGAEGSWQVHRSIWNSDNPASPMQGGTGMPGTDRGMGPGGTGPGGR